MNIKLNRRTTLRAAAAAGIALAAAPSPAGAAPGLSAAECGRRADLAENAILSRHLRGAFGAELAVSAWPSAPIEELFREWNYWFQAHLLDCAVDSASRAPTPGRRERVSALTRGIRTRNRTGWTNEYYDDMAWLLIALERADRLLGIKIPDGMADLRNAIAGSWNTGVGALPWKVGSNFFNACTNGSGGIALARLGDTARAQQLADFLHNRLRDKETGLIFDGVREPGAKLERAFFTYCHGVTIGLETELAQRTGNAEHRRRATALIKAVNAGALRDGVIKGQGGGDGGLFMGILARYLALAAVAFRDPTAAQIVHASAQAAWNHRANVSGLPLFGTEWSQPTAVPGLPENPFQLPDGRTAASKNPVRDLSVQLSGWMVLEADYQVTAAGL